LQHELFIRPGQDKINDRQVMFGDETKEDINFSSQLWTFFRTAVNLL
jgi:hypothetical protein